MNLEQLRNFACVYDAKSILKASESLFITQQGLSKSIRSLEKQVGTALFIRTHAGVIPTAAADSIIGNAKTILAEQRDMEAKLRELTAGREDVVTVSSNNMMLQVFPIGTKVKIESTAPNAAWIYYERTEREIIADVREGKCDFAFSSNPPDETGLYVRKIVTFPLYAMVHASNPLSRKRVLHLTDLEGEDIVAFTADWNLRATLTDYLEEKGFSYRYSEYGAQDAIHLYTLVNNKLGVGIVPSLLMKYLPASPKVKYVPFDEKIVWALSVFAKEDSPKRGLVDRVADAFVERAALME